MLRALLTTTALTSVGLIPFVEAIVNLQPHPPVNPNASARRTILT